MGDKSYIVQLKVLSIARSPLVKLVHDLEVHVGCPEHLLVDEVQGGMSDELVQMAVVVLSQVLAGRGELHFEKGVVQMAHDDKVIVPRHGGLTLVMVLRVSF